MEAEINPIEAKRLREAFKKTEQQAEVNTDVVPRGDLVEIRSSKYSIGKSRDLVIFRDGEAIATIEITNSILKRLKREWIYWNDIQSGLISTHRAKHGSRGRGWN